MPYADPKRNNPTGTKAWADQEKAAGRDFSTKTDLGDIAGYYKEFGLGRGTGAEQQMNFHYKQGAKAPAGPAAPSAPMAGLQAAGGGSGSGGGLLGGESSGAKVIIPPPDMGSSAATGGGGGDAGGYGDAGPGVNVTGPSIFRQGIGTRSLPQYSAILAGLAHVY